MRKIHLDIYFMDITVLELVNSHTIFHILICNRLRFKKCNYISVDLSDFTFWSNQRKSVTCSTGKLVVGSTFKYSFCLVLR